MSDGTHNNILHRYLAIRKQSASAVGLQFVPAGLPLPVPATHE